MFRELFWDICGVCNANCTYCCNGKNSISGLSHKKHSSLIKSEDFFVAINHLYKKKQIAPNVTTINLYNWGEPLLHPELDKILEFLTDSDYKFNLSTNGASEKKFSSKVIKNMGNLTFSMSGFSQKSYDRIHGFDFEKVKQNVQKMIEKLVSNNFKGKLAISFHVYRFNVSEVSKARKYFSSMPVTFTPILAYLNGSSMMFDYCSGKYPSTLKNKIEREIFFEHYFNVNKNKNYVCPQYKILVLDEYCNVVLCCGADKSTKGASLGNIFNVDFRSLKNTRIQSPVCVKCRKLNIDYIWHNPKKYDDE